MSDIDDLDDDDDGLDFDDFNERFVDFLREWGHAEYMLDSCIAAIFALHNGAALVNPAAPVTIERKISFLRTAMETVPALAPVIEQARFVADSFAREKDLRNTIVHGFPLKIEENHTAHFVRVRPTTAGLNYELRVVRPKDWQRLDDTIVDMGAFLLLILLTLAPVPKIPLDETKEESREWAVKTIAGLPVSKRLRDLLNESITGGT